MSTVDKIADAIKNQHDIRKRQSAFEQGCYLGTVQAGKKLLLDNFPIPVDYIQIRTSNRMNVKGGQITTLYDEIQYDVTQDEFTITIKVELQLKPGDRVLASAIKNGTEFVVIGKVMDDETIS